MTIALITLGITRHMRTFRIPYHKPRSPYNWRVTRTFQSHSSAIDGKITIDGIEKKLKIPENPLYVPQKFGESNVKL